MTRQGLEQKQGQELSLTTGMQQSLGILRMANRDITALVHQEAARNPFLRVTGRRPTTQGDTALDTAASTVSLLEHVAHQANLAFRDPMERAFATHLISALEPTGWLGRDLGELADEMAFPLERAEGLLRRMHDFEPAGLFARSLRECLEIQARDSGEFSPDVTSVLARLHLLAKSDLRQLKAETGMDDARLSAAIQSIKSFDPKPGLRFHHDVTTSLLSDLKVRKDGETWIVEVNDAALPVMKVDDSPLQIPGRAQYKGLKELSRQARDLCRMVQRRQSTLLAVGTSIIARQQGFLRDGRIAMMPLSLSDIAEDTGFHISTVSRAVSSTLIETPKGTFPLRTFFTRSVDVGEGSIVAVGSLSALIERLIADEDTSAPLTDARIATLVAQIGLTVTSRTVANHRKSLSIPTSARRRVVDQRQLYAPAHTGARPANRKGLE